MTEARETVPPPPGSELAQDLGWRRLDRRMLLVHPVTEVFRFLPLLIGLFLLGSGGDGDWWHFIGVVLPIAIGVFRFVTTRFRITPGQIELQRGLIGRRILTAPLDRVRTVELTATPIHRLLRLEKVEIGTGSASKDGDDRLQLDSLGAAEARRLRSELLHRASADGSATSAVGPATGAPASEVLLRFDPGWVRYAPLTTGGLVIALAAIGALTGPLFGNAQVRLEDADVVDRLSALAIPVLVLVALIGLAVSSTVLASVGYLLANWGFTVSRDPASRTLHVRRGALTTRETAIDADRLRGVEVHEPLGLRAAGGARLNAIVTGVERQARGSTPLVPAAPRSVVLTVGDTVLAEQGPMHVNLVQHGPAARRRRLIRGIVPLAPVPTVLVLLAGTTDLPLWVALLALPLPLAGLALGLDRYRRLGHALTEAHLVMRWGSLRGRRDALQRDGIIGWNIRQTFFQRRAGLVTLTATTAAGGQAYEVMDIPQGQADALAAAAVPGLVRQFLR